MLNQNSSKKQLLTSVMSLGLSATMLMGTTLAWFTDEVQTGTNKIQAGNLDVSFMMKDEHDSNKNGKSDEWLSVKGESLPFMQKTGDDSVSWISGDKLLWEPGARFDIPALKIENKGNLALKFKLIVNGVTGDVDLAEVIDVYSTTTVNGEEITEKIGTLRELMNDPDGAAHGNLQKGQSTGEYKLSFEMQKSAGNDYANQSISDISFTVLATQDTVEYDSNNNTYDQGALYNSILVTNENQFVEAVNKISSSSVGTIVLNDHIDLSLASKVKSTDGSIITIDGKDIIVDLQGYTINADLSEQGDKATSLFHVKNNGKLTITGDGEIHTKANQTKKYVSAMINNDGGTVVIEDGLYTMDAGSYDQGYLIPTLIDNNSNVANANVTINGGTFKYHRNMFRNFANAASHNNYNTFANIVINGGEFIGTDENGAAIWNQRPNSSAVKGNNYGTVTVNGGTFDKVSIDNEWDSNAVTVNNDVDVKVNHE